MRDGETVHRDYALIAGAAVEIVLAVENATAPVVVELVLPSLRP